MVLRHLIFDVNPTTIFKGDVIMTIYVIRIKPFDVLFINRIDRMTSTVRSTQLVNESEEKWKKGDPQETKIIVRRKTVISKNSPQKRFQN